RSQHSFPTRRSSDLNLYKSLGKNSEAKLLHDVLALKNIDFKKETAAILLADESLLVPLLQSLPQIDINITTGYPLIQSAIYGLLDRKSTRLNSSHVK